MIPLNEIRIGIYYSIGFITDKKGKQHHILEKVKNLLDITHAHLSGQGIPLTPEILGKLGFISNPYQDRFEFGNIHVEHCAIRKICWVEEAPHIKFLHQLQNLVQAKTGNELIFK